MATWFYQLNPNQYSPADYRIDIWENEPWNWKVKNHYALGGPSPAPGDIVVFFYTGGGPDGGFYGWAVVLKWEDEDGDKRLRFRPVPPSDRLKMHPWGGDKTAGLADEVRRQQGAGPLGTLWRVLDENLAARIRAGISSWKGEPG